MIDFRIMAASVPFRFSQDSGARKTSSMKPGTAPPGKELKSALHTITVEAEGIRQLGQALEGPMGQSFVAALAAIKQAKGRVIVSGMGKSGQIGRKIASTFSSTGTPALYLHPAEASHGDLGMITADDVLVVLSWSGETPELKDLIDYSRRFAVPLIALTSKPDSTLAKSADILIALPDHEEACPNGLTPTTSTTMQLVIGDALAVSLLEARGFSARDFRALHPGGKLGAALSFIRDIMHTGAELPLAPSTTIMADALVAMTEKSFGCLGVVDADGGLIGIVTDGDLRRHMSDTLLQTGVVDVMTRNPITIGPDELASAALEVINNSSITSLFVTEREKPVGIVHIHDLLRAGVA